MKKSSYLLKNTLIKEKILLFLEMQVTRKIFTRVAGTLSFLINLMDIFQIKFILKELP